MSICSLRSTRWLAQRLGLSVSTIERLRARGDRNLPPHVVIGSQTIRYDEEAVEAWLAARMSASTGAPPPASQDSPPSLPPIRKRFGKALVPAAVAGVIHPQKT